MSRTFYWDRSGQLSHMKQKLSKMRFALHRRNRMANYRVGCAALLAFQRIHGHSIVPPLFTVPSDSDDPYPAAAKGFPLGRFYSYLINELKNGENKTALRHIAQLRQRGVVVGSKAEAKVRMFLSALRIFKQIHGHVHVPASFVVPTTSEAMVKKGEGEGEGDGGEGKREGGEGSVDFPRWLQGVPLGRWTKNLPQSQWFVARRQLLQEFGLEELQDPERCSGFSIKTVRRVLSALATFKQIHGHVKVPAHYCMRRNPAMRRKEVGRDRMGRWGGEGGDSLCVADLTNSLRVCLGTYLLSGASGRLGGALPAVRAVCASPRPAAAARADSGGALRHR